ncbi:MAG TPA: copper resistance protein CopC [Conexibacter sp.]|nr:copper resistance protein CopC [Conexibacter sp.]
MSAAGRTARALLLALALCCAAPAAAQAHAQLEGTAPQRGAILRRAPAQVAFRFDEPVEGDFGAVRVYDRTGGRVDEGDAFHPAGAAKALGVHLKPGVPQGTYTATYRVVSQDGHIVSGGFAFSIGRATGSGLTVAQLTAAGGSGAVTDAAFGIARGVQYTAIAVALGALAFLLLVWRAVLRDAGGAPLAATATPAFVRALRRLVLAAALAGLASAAAAIVLEGAQAAGISGFSALDAHVVRETLGTRFGTVWGVGALAWLALGALASWALRAPGGRDAASPLPTPARLVVLAPPAVFLLLLPALGGHASSQSPSVLLVPANVLHVAAVSVWAGGIAALLAAVPSATRTLEPPGRSRLLAALLVRFSPLALAAVATILATGLVQSYVYVRTPAHLLDTPFGRAVLIKFLLLLALIGLGAYQRRTSLPRLRRLAAEGAPPGRTGVLLRRALRGEAALILVVLGVTGALTAYPPSTVQAGGPFNVTTTVGPAQLQMTVDPAQTGANQIHVYLLNPRDGSQFRRAQQVTVSETERDHAIGPLEQDAQIAGPGHYVVPDALLAVKGTWTVLVKVRVSAFDEYVAHVQVPIR